MIALMTRFSFFQIEMSCANRTIIKINDQAFNYTEAFSFVFDRFCGAISSFLGVTREDKSENDMLSTSYLVYNAYKAMVEMEISKICDNVRDAYPLIKLVLYRKFTKA